MINITLGVFLLEIKTRDILVFIMFTQESWYLCSGRINLASNNAKLEGVW